MCIGLKKSINISDETNHLTDIQKHIKQLLRMDSFLEMESIDCSEITLYLNEIEKTLQSIWSKIDDYFIDKETKVSN